MGDSIRCYFVEDDDTIVPIPASRFARVFSGQGRAPRYAGQTVRVAEFGVELVNRKPTGRYRVSFYVLRFDAAGKADQTQLLDQARAALDATVAPVLQKATKTPPDNIIHASAKFASRRLNDTFGWTPGLRLRKRLVDLALGRPPD